MKNRAMIGLTSLLFLPGVACAQLVAFSGKDSNPPDEFAFVAMQNLASGTQLYFTESDYDNTTDEFPNSEGTVLFTVGDPLAAGEVVLIQLTAPTTFAVTGNPSGTATDVGASNWSATSGDVIFAYSASNAASPRNSITEIHAAIRATTASFGTQDPSPNYANAIIVGPFATSSSAADFTGNRMAATPATLANEANFTLDDGDLDLTDFGSVPVTLTVFSVE